MKSKTDAASQCAISALGTIALPREILGEPGCDRRP